MYSSCLRKKTHNRHGQHMYMNRVRKVVGARCEWVYGKVYVYYTYEARARGLQFPMW